MREVAEQTHLIRMALRKPMAMAGRRKEEIIVATGDVVAFVGGGGTVATAATPTGSQRL